MMIEIIIKLHAAYEDQKQRKLRSVLWFTQPIVFLISIMLIVLFDYKISLIFLSLQKKIFNEGKPFFKNLSELQNLYWIWTINRNHLNDKQYGLKYTNRLAHIFNSINTKLLKLLQWFGTIFVFNQQKFNIWS